MNEKIRLSHNQTDEMDKKYNQSNSLMEKTMKQLSQVLSSNSNYWCYLIIFIFIIFFFLYKIGH